MTDEPWRDKPPYSPEHAEALALCESEWMPPKALSLSDLQQQPRLPLMSVLNFLAFNAPEPPNDYSDWKRAAYLERAWRALCAAAREDKVRLVGMQRGSQIRQRIESVEFDLNLLLGVEDETIGNLEAMLPHQQSDHHGVFWRDVYVERSSLVDWLNKMLATTGKAAPKVGPKGGRPSSMDAIKTELDEWIAGEKPRLLRELDRWAPSSRKDDYSKARIGRALAAWCANNGGNITEQAITKELREKLTAAVNLL
jgi:hypothetical protein